MVEALCYKAEGCGLERSLNCFNLPNPSSRTIALGFTQNRSEYQKIFLGVNSGRVRKADNLTAICEPIV
jgi:hypothetical protein